MDVWSSNYSNLQFDVGAMIIIRNCSNLMTMFIYEFKIIKKRKIENLIIGGPRALGKNGKKSKKNFFDEIQNLKSL